VVLLGGITAIIVIIETNVTVAWSIHSFVILVYLAEANDRMRIR